MRREPVALQTFPPVNREIAAKIATLASRYECTFVIEFANSFVNMKSMLGLLSQALPLREGATLRAEGPDENEAMDAMLTLLEGLRG